MELVWLSVAGFALLFVAYPTAGSRSAAQKINAKRRVSVAYWGLYKEGSDRSLDECIELPEPCQKIVNPTGGTAYNGGRAIVN